MTNKSTLVPLGQPKPCAILWGDRPCHRPAHWQSQGYSLADGPMCDFHIMHAAAECAIYQEWWKPALNEIAAKQTESEVSA